MQLRIYLAKIGKRYYARFKKKDGNWTNRSLHTTKKAVAKIRLGQFLETLREEERTAAIPSPERITLAELAPRYIDHLRDNKTPWRYIKIQ